MIEIRTGKLWFCSLCFTQNLEQVPKCGGCGKVREDESLLSPEHFQNVSDPDLLKLVEAEPNWKCRTCGYHERALTGECKQCGASQGAGTRPEPTSTKSTFVQAIVKATSKKVSHWIVATVLAAIGALGVSRAVSTEMTGTTTELHWKRVVHVEHSEMETQEGFEYPSTAFDVKPLGARQHPTKTTIAYTTPATEVETFSCHCVASGKEQICQTCTQKIHKDVPTYKPAVLPYYTWHTWTWKHGRDVVEEGEGTKDVKWPPPEEIALNTHLPPGQQERVSDREESFTVAFSGSDHYTYKYHPTSEEEFRKFTPHKEYHIRVDTVGGVSVLK